MRVSYGRVRTACSTSFSSVLYHPLGDLSIGFAKVFRLFWVIWQCFGSPPPGSETSPLPYYDMSAPSLLRHCHLRHPCRGKMAQKSSVKLAKILSVIDFNEKIRQVSSLLTLYKWCRVRYNIPRRRNVSPRPLCLLLCSTSSSHSVRYQSYDNPYADRTSACFPFYLFAHAHRHAFL